MKRVDPERTICLLLEFFSLGLPFGDRTLSEHFSLTLAQGWQPQVYQVEHTHYFYIRPVRSQAICWGGDLKFQTFSRRSNPMQPPQKCV